MKMRNILLSAFCALFILGSAAFLASCGSGSLIPERNPSRAGEETKDAKESETGETESAGSTELADTAESAGAVESVRETGYAEVAETAGKDVSEPEVLLTLHTQTINLNKPGATYKLNAGGVPSGYGITWLSGDESVATVDQYGNVTAKGTGTTTIYASAGYQTATCTVQCNFTYVIKYAEILEEFSQNEYQEDYKFALSYLDGDDVPELFVSFGSSHYTGVDIYSAPDYDAVLIGCGGSFGTIDYGYRTGQVLSSFFAYSGYTLSYGEMINGMIETVDEYHCGPINPLEEGSPMHYSFNGEECTQEVFRSHLDPILSSATFYSIGYSSGWSVNDSTISAFKAYPESFIIMGEPMDLTKYQK